MSQENSQFDIPAIQLRESRTQPRVSLSREIGEAQITHTIFGKAKVRIIRKGDQARRNIVLVALVVVALAVAAWQGWFTASQTEPEQGTPAPAVNTQAQVGVPAPQPEVVAPAAVPLPATPATAITPPVPSQKIATQKAGDLQDAGQNTVEPARPKSKSVPIKPKVVPAEPVGKPQAAAATANKDALKTQSDLPPARVLPARRPVAPAVAAPAQPAASSPAAVAPLGKDDITIQPPVGDRQLSAPINPPGN